MPWCTSCDRFLNPPTVNPDGSCPHCGQIVTPGHAHESADYSGAPPVGADETEFEPGRLPWHLKLILVALALYLGWRAWEALAWTVGRL